MAHAESPLGQEALYRQGLALRLAGDLSGARTTWTKLQDTHAQLATLWQVDDRLIVNDPVGALAILKQTRCDDARAWQHVALTWVKGLRQATVQEDRDTIEKYVAWQLQEMPDERLVREPASYALTWLGRPEEAIARFPEQPRARKSAACAVPL